MHLETWLNAIDTIVWGPWMLALLLGTGLYFTLALRFLQIRRLGPAFRMLFKARRGSTSEGKPGNITPFQSLMTALAATIGTGNIAGVGTAIALGGPGAVFWMWITALFGMATKYAEAVLAIRYRNALPDGRYVGGPMYYIKNGLGRHWAWLGVLFALFASIAGFGIGNMVQSNSVTAAVSANFGTPNWAVGLVLATLTFLVIIGGVKRIATVASYLVPFMAIAYIAGGLFIILRNISDVPEGLMFIVRNAFTNTAATGGFAGAAVWAGLRFGVARGIFSNEAGLGSAPIAHAAAKTNDAVQVGLIAMLGTFIDTLVVCTITALVIVTVHVPVEMADGSTHMLAAWASGKTGAELSALAFGAGLPFGGAWIVTVGLIFFAFSTLIGWSYYGERSAEFLFGAKIITPYRYLWVIFVFVGSVVQLNVVWTFADIANALMAGPNLIALLLLSGTVVTLTRASPKTAKPKAAEQEAAQGAV